MTGRKLAYAWRRKFFPTTIGSPAEGFSTSSSELSCDFNRSHAARRASARSRRSCVGVFTLLLATTLAACVSSQRFAAPAQQPRATPPPAASQAPSGPSGPYTREREDREFGR
jgi:hypothetical protein